MQKIGHRGAKAYIAENTIASIAKALQLGANAIEIDVHLCKSGEVVVIHDKTVNRTTTGLGKVGNFTLEELRLFTSKEYRIPTLEEVLLFCETKCIVHIELKGKGTAIKVAKIVSKAVVNTSWTYKNLFVSSFKYGRLKKIAFYNSNINTGIIAKNKLSKALNFAINNNCTAVYIAFNKVDTSYIALAKAKNIQVYVWTVNSIYDIEKAKKMAINGIISDFPDFL